jgi:hypothetical protein
MYLVHSTAYSHCTRASMHPASSIRTTACSNSMFNKTRLCCCRDVLPLSRNCVTQCQPVLWLSIPAPCSSNTSLKQCLSSGMILMCLVESKKLEQHCTQTCAPHRTVSSCNALYIRQLYNVLLLDNNTTCGNCSPVLILLASGRIGETSAALQVGMPPNRTLSTCLLQCTIQRSVMSCHSAQQ